MENERNSVAGTEFGKIVAGVETIKTCSSRPRSLVYVMQNSLHLVGNEDPFQVFEL